MNRIKITCANKNEIDKRIKDHLKTGYRLVNQGATKNSRYFEITKYWAILEKEDLQCNVMNINN